MASAEAVERLGLRSMSTILNDDPVKLRILNLYYVVGMTQAEIGEDIGLSQQAVAWHINSCHERLREAGSFIIDLDTN